MLIILALSVELGYLSLNVLKYEEEIYPMSHYHADNNERQPFDTVIQAIADYALSDLKPSDEALTTARYCLLDTLGCGLLALRYPECTKLLGPIVPGATLKDGAKVPGTAYQLDPVQAAFNIGAMIRWLDYNDTWLAAEWGHPSDNLGGILATCDYVSRQRTLQRQAPLTMQDVLVAMIKAHEIQGILALNHAFNRVGLDHVILVKIATTAVVSALLGGTREQVLNAVSLAWVDGQSLRTYRHAPNTGSRKSWAAGDATSRGVRLALIAMKGEMGYPSVITAPTWGFTDASFRGQPITLARPFGAYVMENILFKIAYPAEFHAQTAVECALKLFPKVQNKWDSIERIEISTQESAVRIISKEGALHNPADRDHCLQYMIAIGLLFGELTADHYEDAVAKDPRIDALRAKMHVKENKDYSRDYLDPEKRSIANAIEITFKDGSKTELVAVEYPVGHRRRREEGIPLLVEKFKQNLLTCYPKTKAENILHLGLDAKQLALMPVNQWVDMLVC